MGKKIKTDQFAELAAAVIRNLPRGITPEMAQYWIIHNFELELALKGALAASLPVINFRRLLDMCKQDWVNPDFNEANCPLEPVAPDEHYWEVYEHHFDRMMTGEEAFAELEKLGYRLLGGLRRAMEFIAAHPDIQLDHPLIITARWQIQDGVWYAPVARRHGGERDLGLNCLDRDFSPNFGWLVLRKLAV
ncbi:MAG: hypothetical protein WC348_01080 [Patescibacteria group bacterium]|jgi:hypothetical protein